MGADLFNIPSRHFAKLAKVGPWEESKHPRDQDGKFTSGGGGGGGSKLRTAATIAAGTTAAAGLAALGLRGAASLGVRGARHLFPDVRRASLIERMRNAQAAARRAYVTSDFGSPRATRGAMEGAITASGREHASTNALRGAYGIQSPASRRRAAARTFRETGAYRPRRR